MCIKNVHNDKWSNSCHDCFHFFISTGRLLFTFILQNKKCRIYWVIFLWFVNLIPCIAHAYNHCALPLMFSAVYMRIHLKEVLLSSFHIITWFFLMFLLHVLFLFHFNLKCGYSVWQNCVFFLSQYMWKHDISSFDRSVFLRISITEDSLYIETVDLFKEHPTAKKKKKREMVWHLIMLYLVCHF